MSLLLSGRSLLRSVVRTPRLATTFQRNNTVFIPKSVHAAYTHLTALELTDPSNGVAWTEVPMDNLTSVKYKYQRAVKGFKEWAGVPLPDKVNIIKKFGELVENEKEDLAYLLTLEMGKPISQARNELNGLQTRIKYFVENIDFILEKELARKGSNFEEKLAYEPLGVIVNISAWNYPYFVSSNVFLPGLLTGNAILFKPSEITPLTGASIERLLHEAGVPKDAFICVQGKGDIAEALLSYDIGGGYFTGSYNTGKKVGALLGAKCTRTVLELGGKDPAYVRADADIEKAAASLADGAMYNNGQSCCSVERIYIHKHIYEKFVEAYVAEVEKLGKPMDPRDEKCYFGPLARRPQPDFLYQLAMNAIRRGAKLVYGNGEISKPNEGFWYPPTVLADVNHRMEMQHVETFGPLIGLQRVRDDDEAIQLMNDTFYGLTAAVYSESKDASEEILAKVDAGTVYWNACDRVSPYVPWSGRKASGMGSTLGKLGVLAFMKPKAYHLCYT
eukprot:TRINITY_DN2047_c0_g5_i1.p1 TRINITY_DN2047_c0_g5~~TRINITY_DN2047_c0_g5_i1.p1  ORF type:complete len:503 (-),score=111.61 TRINITY_DN2047_c0_g5_i1:154-1662(-)